jgi:hypothetical protein
LRKDKSSVAGARAGDEDDEEERNGRGEAEEVAKTEAEERLLIEIEN